MRKDAHQRVKNMDEIKGFFGDCFCGKYVAYRQDAHDKYIRVYNKCSNTITDTCIRDVLEKGYGLVSVSIDFSNDDVRIYALFYENDRV